MKERNKDPLPGDSRLRRVVRHLPERVTRPGRIVYQQALRGASYSLGSCAVTVAVFWLQNRH
ncbi:hypothetical protein ACWGI9_45570 [Streptomyces sp. NPDC054833]